MFKKIFKDWSGERLETFVYNELTAEHLHRYAITLDIVAGKKVLDIACGEGYGSNLLAQRAAFVTAIDIDNKTIKKAKKKYGKSSLEFTIGDVERIPCNKEEFDIAISFETIEHVENQEQAIAEISRVLKPEGLLIISTPNKNLSPVNPEERNRFHKKELAKDELRYLLIKKFDKVVIINQYPGYNSFITTENNFVLESYSGSFLNLEKKPNAEPSYFLAFASNNILPELKNSFFNPSELITEGIKNNTTYRIGNIFTSVARKIRDSITR